MTENMRTVLAAALILGLALLGVSSIGTQAFKVSPPINTDVFNPV